MTTRTRSRRRRWWPGGKVEKRKDAVEVDDNQGIHWSARARRRRERNQIGGRGSSSSRQQAASSATGQGHDHKTTDEVRPLIACATTMQRPRTNVTSKAQQRTRLHWCSHALLTAAASVCLAIHPFTGSGGSGYSGTWGIRSKRVGFIGSCKGWDGPASTIGGVRLARCSLFFSCLFVTGAEGLGGAQRTGRGTCVCQESRKHYDQVTNDPVGHQGCYSRLAYRQSVLCFQCIEKTDVARRLH